jgi:hypothetical protein
VTGDRLEGDNRGATSEPSALSTFTQLTPVIQNGGPNREYLDQIQFVAEKNVYYYFSIDSRSDQTGSVSLDFLPQPGYQIGAPSIENGRINFTILGDVEFVPTRFRLESSINLSQWDLIEGTYLLENGVFNYKGKSPSLSGLFHKTVGVAE